MLYGHGYYGRGFEAKQKAHVRFLGPPTPSPTTGTIVRHTQIGKSLVVCADKSGNCGDCYSCCEVMYAGSPGQNIPRCKAMCRIKWFGLTPACPDVVSQTVPPCLSNSDCQAGYSCVNGLCQANTTQDCGVVCEGPGPTGPARCVYECNTLPGPGSLAPGVAQSITPVSASMPSAVTSQIIPSSVNTQTPPCLSNADCGAGFSCLSGICQGNVGVGSILDTISANIVPIGILGTLAIIGIAMARRK